MVRPAFIPVQIALLVLALAPVLCAAPPFNDNLASALTLDSDVPDDTSTTVDATLEPAEPLPPGYTAAGYQGTVWWQWTPVFSDWHEINTSGSAIDTVLTVWSDANGTGPLTLIHVNDDAKEGGLSRIRFFADAATTYKIAVASRNATRGAVTLTAFVATAPISRVTAASFTPASVDVTASSVAVTADISLTSTPSFQTGHLTLYGPTNNSLATAPLSAASRISGTQASGVYRMVLTVPQGAAAGTCRWGIRMADFAATIDSSYGREGMTPLPAGMPDAITVANNAPSDPYALWAGSHGLTGAAALRTADPDHDGMNNLFEYESGLPPNEGACRQVQISGTTIIQAGTPLITTVGTGAQKRLRVVYLRRLGDASVQVGVEFSNDLANWSPAPQTPAVIATTATHEALAVEDEIMLPVKTSRFARVKYTLVP